MDRGTRLAMGLMFLAILWLFLVFLLFYSVQKPVGVNNLLAAFDSLLNIATVVVLLLLAAALGERLLAPILFSSPGERLVFAVGTGLGIISLATLALGMVGLLYPLVFFGLGLVLTIILWKNISGLLRALPQLLPSFSPPRALLFFLATSLGISLLAALTPPISFDSIMYHLAGPQLYIQDHRIFAFDQFPLYFPSLVEMLFMAAMLLKGEIAAQILHFAFGLLLAFALFIFVGHYFSSRAAWWSVALVWSMPLVPLILGWAYVDLALAFYQLLAVWAIVKWFDTQDRLFLILGGVNAGWIMGIKYTAFVLPLALSLLVLYHSWRYWRWSWSKILQSLLIFTLATGIVASPWYFRNLILVGNPVYPFFFGGKFWDGWLANWYEQAGSGLGTDLGRILALPLTATLGIQDETFYDGRIGPLFLALLPLLIISRVLPAADANKNRLVNYLVSIFLIQFAFWTGGVIHSQSLFQGRLLLPGLVFLSVALAHSVDRVGVLSHRLFSPQRFLNIVLGIVLALGLITQALEYLAQDPLPYLVGWEGKEGYLERNLAEHYRAIQAINQLSEMATVQFLWEPRIFYCSRDCRPDALLGNFKHWVYLHRQAPAIAQELKTQGITHLLVYEGGRKFLQAKPRWAMTSAEQEAWGEFVANHLDEIYADEKGTYILYALR